MGAAAQLPRVGADLHDANPVAVFVTEEGQGPQLLGLVFRRFEGVYVGVFDDPFVGPTLHLDDLLGSESGVVAEVEPEASRFDEGPGLLDVRSEDVPQGPVQKVSSRVALGDEFTTSRIEHGPCLLTDLHGSRNDPGPMAVHAGEGKLGIGHLEGPGFGQHSAGVADLASRLRVEGGPVQEDFNLLALVGPIHRLPFP